MSSLIYFFKQSLEGFTRNLSTTLGSIITIFLSLFIIGIFLVGGSLISNVVTSIESDVSITAYVADTSSRVSTASPTSRSPRRTKRLRTSAT